ncbi:MAG TPA: hypothetical protein VF720_04160 [Candidatus Eisenbacteria bacterium]
MKSWRPFLALPLLATLVTLTAAAPPLGIINGDFSAGNVGWNVNQPANWTVSFPAAGGNPDAYGRIQSPFGNSGGTGSIFQTFLCGEPGIPGNCVITLDYRLDQLDASQLSGRVVVRIDGTVEYTWSLGPVGWTNVTVTVPCGNHVISLELEVSAGNNGWAACFDNVRASCEPIVPTRSSTWGRIKSLIIE